MTHSAHPKKAGDGRLFRFFFEIGDSEGSGRPGNMADTHSLKWHRSGFGTAAFNAIPAAFSGRYSEKPPLEILPTDHPIGRAEY